MRNIKKQIEKFGSISDHKELLKQYCDTEDPSFIPNNTSLKYSWKCNICNYKWIASPRQRHFPKENLKRIIDYKINKKFSLCPKCKYNVIGETGRLTKLKKSISLRKKFPELIKEWSDLNKINPDEISYASKRKVYWKCLKNKDHKDWLASINNRSLNKTNCPECMKNFQSSRAEIRVYSELKYIFKNIEWRFKIEKNEIDVYLPDFKVGVEIDGPLHKLKNDKKKNSFFKNQNIKIFRLRDLKLKRKISETDFFVNTSKIKISDINKLLLRIQKYLTLNKKLSQKIKDYIKYESFRNIKEYNKLLLDFPFAPLEKSILITHPKLSETWDYEKNYPFKPQMFTQGMMQKVFWICSLCSESYKHSISKKTDSGILTCKKCSYNNSNQLKRIKGKLSLQEEYPKKIKEYWNFKKNHIDPQMVTSTSHKKAYWFCKKHNYEFFSAIRDVINAKHCCKLGFLSKDTSWNKKKIFEMNDEGKILKRWSSISKCAKEEKLRTSSISRVCRGERKSYRGRFFKFDTESKSKF